MATGCNPVSNESAGPAFRHAVETPERPWTHDRFDADDGRFTFAIFSDLNGDEREGVFAQAIAQLEVLRPELILNVGDLIDGVSDDPQLLGGEWDHFDVRARQATAPVFYVGGNHDLTSESQREVWAARYGPRYYHFVYKDVLFLVLDTEDYTPERRDEIHRARAAAIEVLDGHEPERARSMAYFQMAERITGEIGPEQSNYFLEVLEDHPQVRWTFLFMHKPVWQREDEPEFAAIEAALFGRPYTVFNGHLHHYSHTVRNERDYIMLGTTGGGQPYDQPMSFDHVTLVTMAVDGPSIASLKLDGILDKTGQLPGGDPAP